MSSEKTCLLRTFEQLKQEYITAWKSKLYDKCKNLKCRLADVAVQARALGISLGCNPTRNLQPIDLEYSINALEFVTRNLGAEDADIILRDIHRLNGCEGCGRCIESEKRFTLRGFDTYEVDEQSNLSIPEREDSQQPKIPVHPVTRSCDHQKAERSE